MYKPTEIITLIEQAQTGEMPPIGDVAQANEIIGFAYGLYFDKDGQLAAPGPVNEAIADFIVDDEVLREKNMTLQEELAVAVTAREPKMSGQIETLETIKKPGKAFNTHELLVAVKPKLMARGVGSLAVVAFRHHLPRAAAEVKKAGFEVSTPDMASVGDFDPQSPQKWIRNQKAWIRRETLVIAAFAAAQRI